MAAALTGVALMFWHRLVGWVRRILPGRRRQPTSPTSDHETAPEHRPGRRDRKPKKGR